MCPSTGTITVNIDEIESSDNPAKQAAAQGKLTKELILKEYKDCFDKLGRFPGEKYHIQLIDNPVPVIRAPRTLPVYILPFVQGRVRQNCRQKTSLFQLLNPQNGLIQ